jgi:hypothetical protein
VLQEAVKIQQLKIGLRAPLVERERSALDARDGSKAAEELREEVGDAIRLAVYVIEPVRVIGRLALAPGQQGNDSTLKGVLLRLATIDNPYVFAPGLSKPLAFLEVRVERPHGY